MLLSKKIIEHVHFFRLEILVIYFYFLEFTHFFWKFSCGTDRTRFSTKHHNISLNKMSLLNIFLDGYVSNGSNCYLNFIHGVGEKTHVFYVYIGPRRHVTIFFQKRYLD